jgi:hypothetical protein
LERPTAVGCEDGIVFDERDQIAVESITVGEVRAVGGVLVDDELRVRNEERGPALGFNVGNQRTSVEDRTSLRSRWKRLQT